MVNQHLTRLSLVAATLTGRQSRVTGDADSSLLLVHVKQLALEAAARRTEHLQNTETHIWKRLGSLFY